MEVFDARCDDAGGAYYAMELLDGEDLAATLSGDKRLSWPRVRHIAVQICDALAAAHAVGVVHRDLKPANCIRTSFDGDPDFIKVLDFGVSKLFDRSYTTLTGPGELIGTLRYMAPEQVESGQVDPRADVYALGAMMYHLLTGRTAADGDNALAVVHALLTRTPEPFSVVAPDLSDAVWGVVSWAMSRDPALRPASMQELAAAIAAIDTDGRGADANESGFAPTRREPPLFVDLYARALAIQSRVPPWLWRR